MKNILAILSLSFILFACGNNNNEQNNQAEETTTTPAPVVTTPPPAQPDPDSTSVEINREGVEITNKDGKSGTDVKIDDDSSHVIIKKK